MDYRVQKRIIDSKKDAETFVRNILFSGSASAKDLAKADYFNEAVQHLYVEEMKLNSLGSTQKSF
jgi:hypothetical protein